MIFRPKQLLALSIVAIILASANIPMIQFITARKTTPETGGIQAAQPRLKMLTALALPAKAIPEIQLAASQPPLEEISAAAVAAPVIVLPEGLAEFIELVKDGSPESVRGIFIEGILSLPVVQQPAYDNGFVSSLKGEITEFQSARRNGITGLLAHNYLSGDLFYQLEKGQEIWIIRGDGSFLRYRVADIQSFQKLSPRSMQSEFVDLSNGEQLTTSQVFNRFYSGSSRLTLQTCLARGTLSNWGLTFWTAEIID